MKRKALVLLLASLFFPVVCNAALPGYLEDRMGTMKGQVFFEEQPVPNAVLAFFRDDKGLPPISDDRGAVPSFLSRTDAEGQFEVRLLQGSYYLGILLRSPEEPPGPPRAGEKYYFADDGQGKLRKLPIEDFKISEVGRVNASPPEVFKETDDSFTAEGELINAETGEPYAGAVVVARPKLNQLRPDFISKRTGEDGKFVLKLPAGKSYYLMARVQITGNKPNPGDKIGTYGINTTGGVPGLAFSGATPPAIPGEAAESRPAGKAAPVTGSVGEVVSGLNIMMFDLPDRQALKAAIQKEEGAPGFESGAPLRNVYFAVNSAVIDERSYAELDNWALFLKDRPDIKIELIGHTDNTGSEEYNLDLSHRRARAIADYLFAKGVNPDHITVVGYGETKPVEENETIYGRSRNRRVEVRFILDEQEK